jgi:hypothetical protein
MKTSLLNMLCAAALLFALTGCGGGGGGGNGSGGGGELTDEQRDIAIDAVWNKYKSLTHRDPVADAKTMVAFMKGRTEFKDAGYSSDLTIWGQFTDGPMYGLVNNDPDLGKPRSAVMPIAPSRTGARGATRALTLPSGSDVHLLHGFSNDRPNINDQIESMLDRAEGYHVHKGTASLDAFKAVQASTGLLVTNMHAALCPDPLDKRREHIYLVTNTETPPRHPTKGEPLYDDWKAGRIYLFGTDVNSRVIGIGPGWVQQNMHFGPNSLWINNACMAFNREFMDSAFQQGLGAYVGWDESVHFEVANAAALFLVDRLTGANVETAHREDPPQRPFDLQSIVRDLKQRPGLNPVTNPTMDHSLWIELDTSNLLNTKLPDAHLLYLYNDLPGAPPDETGSLAPSIDYMTVTATGNNETEIRINGMFGSKQGKVSIAGTDIPVKSWEPLNVVCSLPAHDQAGAHGDVVVEVAGHRSNPVQLTMWELTFTNITQYDFSGKYVTDKPVPPTFVTYYAEPTGSAMITTSFKIYLRADIHEPRKGPGQKPPFSPPVQKFVISINNWATKDAKVDSVRVSGSASEKHTNDKNDYTYTFFNKYSLEGASSIALDGSDSRNKGGQIYGQVDMGKRELGVVFSVGLDPIVHFVSSSEPPGVGTSHLISSGGGVSTPVNKFALDESYNIAGGSKIEVDDTAQATRGVTVTRSVSWSGKVSSPPRQDSPRSARIATGGRAH